MSRARNLGELLAADGQVEDSKIDSVSSAKLSGTISDARLSADKQLPRLKKSGGALTGAITTNSTFDGRDVGTDGTKLDTVETSATADQTAAQIKTAYEGEVSAFTDAQFTKLSNIETSATADQTNAEIRTAVEAATDSNVFTDADHSHLNAIEASATADQTNAEIKTAYEANANTNEFSDAEQTKLSNIETAATADQTAAEIRALVQGATDSQVFTDADHTKLNSIATDANDYNHPTNHAISVTTGLQAALDGKVDDSQVLTNVPSGALFTDTNTTYSVGDGGLTTNDFTNADHSKLNAIAASANNYAHPSNHAISVITGLQTALNLKAPLASPALTGAPTAPTAAANTNTTQVATTAYVQTELTDLIGGAPATLDTLNELAAAINDDATYASTLTTALATKVAKTSNQALSTAANAMTISGHTITLNRGDSTTDTVTVPDNNTTYSVGDGGLTQKNFTTADNTKLDGIETAATADQTAAQLLTAIKTVDGTGTGLDADLLDGVQGSGYALAHSHPYLPTTTPTKLTNINTLGNESKIIPWHASTVGRPAASQSNEYGAGIQLAYDGSFASQIAHDFHEDNLYYRKLTLGTDSGTWNKVWSNSNDGSGSGLDADTLDGYNAEEGVVNNSIVKRDGNGAIKVGNILLDKDNAEINLKSGAGTTSGAINWTFNTAGTDYASIKLPYATRASTGLHIDAGYPITIDSSSSTGIKFLAGGAQRAVINSAGVNVTGNITLSGTVDGRDVAADGTKLNTIETSATADQTAAEILTKIKTVDGTGSGLDADLLDGAQGSLYQRTDTGTLPVARMNKVLPTSGNYVWNGNTAASGYTTGLQTSFVRSADNWPEYGSVLHVGGRGGSDAGGDYQIYCGHGSANGGNHLRFRNADNSASPSDSWTSWKTIWDTGNDGAGSGLDADLLDGVQGSSYLLASATVNGYARAQGRVVTNCNDAAYRVPGMYGFNNVPSNGPGTNYSAMIVATNSDVGIQLVGGYTNDQLYFRGWHSSGGTYLAWRKTWHNGNDGSGSGLDSDTVDGIQGSSFLRSDANDIATGNITFSGEVVGTGNLKARRNQTNGNYTTAALWTESYGSTTTGIAFHISGNVGNFLEMRTDQHLYWKNNKVWFAGNDGSGSGLDADLLDGQQGSYYANESARKSVPSSGNYQITNSTSPQSLGGGYLRHDFLNSGGPPGSNYRSVLSISSYTGGSQWSQLSFNYNNGINTPIYFRQNQYNGTSWGSWIQLWDSANDGSGSGLDADTVDGHHAILIYNSAGTLIN